MGGGWGCWGGGGGEYKCSEPVDSGEWDGCVRTIFESWLLVQYLDR